MEETALDLRFARMSYDNHTPGVSNLTLSRSQKFCLGIGSKLLNCSAWVIQWRSTRCFLATWVTSEVQSVFGDVKLDLSLATSVPEPTEASSDLWGSTLIIERVYGSNFLNLLLWVSHMLFCIQRKKQPSIRGLHE
jgi:hypothetical protein